MTKNIHKLVNKRNLIDLIEGIHKTNKKTKNQPNKQTSPITTYFITLLWGVLGFTWPKQFICLYLQPFPEAAPEGWLTQPGSSGELTLKWARLWSIGSRRKEQSDRQLLLLSAPTVLFWDRVPCTWCRDVSHNWATNCVSLKIMAIFVIIALYFLSFLPCLTSLFFLTLVSLGLYLLNKNLESELFS